MGLKPPFNRLPNAPEFPDHDRLLANYRDALEKRRSASAALESRICAHWGTLENFARAHEFFGLHIENGQWVFREYAPNAEYILLVGDFSNWNNDERFRLKPVADHIWEGRFPLDAISHGMRYCMRVKWSNGGGERLPAYLTRAVQDEVTKRFTAQVWNPEQPYSFKYPRPSTAAPLIYEAHVGIADECGKVATFREFIRHLPEISGKGYNTIQLMGIMEHPYYGSFGYHVSNFFAVSSRFGIPEDFKALVDEAHKHNLRVIIDLVHSHSVKNDCEGLGNIDGDRTTYFHAGARGIHSAWDSLCFDYGKIAVLRLLLSNCRYFLEEYNVDGFRFDGVTSMIYKHHGLNREFNGYEDYFSSDTDEDAISYLTLANKLIHRLRPDAITIAEDVSGMPLLASEYGVGFDCRLSMGVSDLWFKLLDLPDEKWSMNTLFRELTNRRRDERSISYVECHDQAIVGGQSAFFRMAGGAVYDSMQTGTENAVIDRAIALHKMMRLMTAASAGHGYLNFIGNEFGHPEWIDLPREGNNWSYHYARRQWSLEKNPDLRYCFLSRFDRRIMDIVASKNFYDCRVQLLFIDEQQQIIGFERNDFIFVFNFNPEKSFQNREFEILPGVCRMVLDSDDIEFGGRGRRQPGQEYSTMSRQRGSLIRIDLPVRSAVVLKRYSSIQAMAASSSPSV